MTETVSYWSKSCWGSVAASNETLDQPDGSDSVTSASNSMLLSSCLGTIMFVIHEILLYS